jgi:hypothetical protein
MNSAWRQVAQKNSIVIFALIVIIGENKEWMENDFG